MIKFLLKGILRDKSRSVLPVIVISIGVGLTVLLSGYLAGAFGDMIDQNARFDTGHVKVMTKAYAENIDQLPNDLALLEIDGLMDILARDYSNMKWTERIRFGGLVDVPDENGESKGQGPASGLAFNLLDRSKGEVERLNIEKSLVTGALPKQQDHALLGHDFAEKLDLKLGDTITYFGTTMNGSMSLYNFTLQGTIRFGMAAMDRGLMIVDVTAAQTMLDMEGGAGEILGFSKMKAYDDERQQEMAVQFNTRYQDSEDEFAPVMLALRDQNNLGEMIDYSSVMTGIFVFIFVFAMSIVLWNTGLLAGLRRYQEFGIRLALGESKGQIYSRLIMEAIIIGIIGSIVGTLLGLAGTYYLQVYGIDISEFSKNSSMLMPSVMRARITPDLFYIGFIPGLLAMVLGNMLSGIGIYRRETARLFKELEV